MVHGNVAKNVRIGPIVLMPILTVAAADETPVVLSFPGVNVRVFVRQTHTVFLAAAVVCPLVVFQTAGVEEPIAADTTLDAS